MAGDVRPEPTRQCRVCRKRFAKSQLTRWTLVNDELVRDPSQTASGRGYYSCSEKCAEILPRTIKRKK